MRRAGNQVVRSRFTGIPELTALVYSSLVEYLVDAGVIRSRPFDASACPDAAISDLSRKKLSEFLARAQAERNYPLGPRTAMEKALAHLNLLDRGPAEPCSRSALRQTAPALSYYVGGQVPSFPRHDSRQADPVLSDL